MNTHSKFSMLVTVGGVIFTATAVTIAYACIVFPLAKEHPISGVLVALSYVALLCVIVPGIRGVFQSTRTMQSWHRSLHELMQERDEEMEVLAAEQYDKLRPFVGRQEKLQYQWPMRTYLQHRCGRQACWTAGMSFLAFGFLCAERAFFGDKRGTLIWGAVMLAVPLLIQLVGVTSYHDAAERDQILRRLSREQPRFFEDEE